MKGQGEQMNNDNGVLETIIHNILEHEKLHPDHGVGCICQDKNAGMLRKVINEMMPNNLENCKSRSNLQTAIIHVIRSI